MLRPLCRSLGGLWFVTALVYAVYTFTAVWAAPSAAATGGGLVSALLANAAMFAAFALHHSLLARTRVKQRLLSRVGEDDQRTIYVWVASSLLIAVLASWRPIGHLIYAAPGALAYVCRGGQLLGLLVIVRAAGVIDPLELAGVRRSRGTLEVRGPYRWVRHPIYLGFLLAVWLPASMTGDRLWFAMLTTAYLVAAIPLEERTMRRRLGAGYQGYRDRVRWRLLPGVY